MPASALSTGRCVRDTYLRTFSVSRVWQKTSDLNAYTGRFLLPRARPGRIGYESLAVSMWRVGSVGFRLLERLQGSSPLVLRRLREGVLREAGGSSGVEDFTVVAPW